MSVIISTNTAATSATNNLSSSSQALQRSLNRLSSGSRIVNPSDDAGGLAVAMKLSAASRRMAATSTNLLNTQSFLQTQDGTLKVTGKILERISELKTLSSDTTKSASDLSNYDQEFKELQKEILSIGAAKFNGINLFSSSAITAFTSEDQQQSMTINGVDLLGASGSGSGSGGSWTDFSGLADTAHGGTYWTSSNAGIAWNGSQTPFHGNGTLTTTQSNITGPYTMNLTYDLDGGIPSTLTLSGGGSGSLDLGTLGGGASKTLSISVDASGNATWTQGASSGSIANFASGGGSAITFKQTSWAMGTNDLHLIDFSITGSGGGGGGAGGGGSGNINTIATATSLSAVGLSTVTGAIEDISTYRAQNGAYQSRVGYSTDLLITNKANLEQATSRIADVDVAEESSLIAKNNVLVQAGTFMLSQANQSSQLALRLIT